jgi:mersacidin/lichenicidin family type 2 lantibiotic
MTSEQVIQSWKDEDFRASLPDSEQALLPDNPAGLVELTDEELQQLDLAGGNPIASAILVVSAIVTVVSVVYSATSGCVQAGDVGSEHK